MYIYIYVYIYLYIYTVGEKTQRVSHLHMQQSLAKHTATQKEALVV